MRSVAPLAAIALAGCMGTGTEPPAGSTGSPFASLPDGVTRDMVYSRQPDPRAGPCYYYRVEGFEVQLSCEA